MRLTAKTRHRDQDLDGLRVHYREAGSPSSTAAVLLHGSPSSSYSFRAVMPTLGEHVYAVAPDLPGYGLSDAPAIDEFDYGFEHQSRVVQALLDHLGVQRYVLFVTDYSTPVGYFLATRHPERVLGLVVQNGNAHEDGLGPPWDTARRYWANPSEENRAALPTWLDFEGTRATYLSGLPEELQELHPRESWHLDWSHVSQPGHTDIHFRVFADYATHVARFDEIAAYHAEYQPAVLVLWGRHDTFFDLAEVLAYSRELDHTEAHLFDAGHFLLERHAAEVAELVLRFINDVDERAGAGA